MPGIPTGNPYVIPGQTQIYPQGPPPTYDQALTHPAAIVGQHVKINTHPLLNFTNYMFSDVSTWYHVCCRIPHIFRISSLYSNAVLSIIRCIFLCNATNTITTCYYDSSKYIRFRLAIEIKGHISISSRKKFFNFMSRHMRPNCTYLCHVLITFEMNANTYSVTSLQTYSGGHNIIGATPTNLRFS